MNDEMIEEEIIAKGLDAPRITLPGLHAKIADVEIVKHVSKTGQVLRWVVLTMENGFAVVGKPSCSVSPENDNAELGEKIAVQNAQDEVWALEGYALKQRLFEQAAEQKPHPVEVKKVSKLMLGVPFGVAIEALKNGRRVARSGWNGVGIFIELQVPDAHSKMTSPYIFINTTGLQTDNPDAPKSLVPWLASQTDMLAEDWQVV